MTMSSMALAVYLHGNPPYNKVEFSEIGGLRDCLNREYFNTFDESNDICHTLRLALAIENR